MTRLSVPWNHFISTVAPRRDGELRFNLRELSGSLGDLGTFLPLSVAMALGCGMDLGLIFIFAGLMNLLTGIWFRQPIPVQPMKAIAAVAIAEGLTAGEIASAGMMLGVILFVLALVGGIDWIARLIPKSVVRGIQAGIGIKLAWTGLTRLGALPAVGWDSQLIALVLGAVVCVSLFRRQPVLLYIFALGFVLLWFAHPDAYAGFSVGLPSLHVIWPSGAEWWGGLWSGAIPQVPLTLLNSVIAVCALSEDYFPGRGIEPRRMAASVGLMNLLCVPWGGMPMCHGAGGLAAQYRFGARTGGSVVMLGVLKILAGLLIGGLLVTALPLYPISILAVMIVAAGLMLAWAASDTLFNRSAPLMLITIVAILVWGTALGFVIGCVLAMALKPFSSVRNNRE